MGDSYARLVEDCDDDEHSEAVDYDFQCYVAWWDAREHLDAIRRARGLAPVARTPGKGKCRGNPAESPGARAVVNLVESLAPRAVRLVPRAPPTRPPCLPMPRVLRPLMCLPPVTVQRVKVNPVIRDPVRSLSQQTVPPVRTLPPTLQTKVAFTSHWTHPQPWHRDCCVLLFRWLAPRGL